MPTRCNLPFFLWSHAFLQYSLDPNFSGVQPSRRLGWTGCQRAAQKWQGGKYMSYLCLFQCLPVSVPMLARNMAIVEPSHALSQMPGSPTQNLGKWKACCRKERCYFQRHILKENLLYISFKYRKFLFGSSQC